MTTTSERSGRRPANDDQRRLEREVANSDSLIFSQLPAELRNEIWRLTLPDVVSLSSEYVYTLENMPDSDSKYLQIEIFPPSREAFHVDQHLKLLHICRQMRSEIASVFFGEKTFVLGMSQTEGRHTEYCVRQVISFFNAIDDNFARLLRHVVLVESYDPWYVDRVVGLDLRLKTARSLAMWHVYRPEGPSYEHEVFARGTQRQLDTWPRQADVDRVLRSLNVKSDGMAGEGTTTRRQLLSWFRSFSTWGEVLDEQYLSISREGYEGGAPFDEWVAQRAEDVSELARLIDEVE